MAKCEAGVMADSRSRSLHLQSALAPNSVSQRSVFLRTSNEIYVLFRSFFFSFLFLILLFLFPLPLFFLLHQSVPHLDVWAKSQIIFLWTFVSLVIPESIFPQQDWVGIAQSV